MTPDPVEFADPYLEWSRLTGFRGHAALVQGQGRVPLLVEATSRQWKAVVQAGWVQAPAVHRDVEAFRGTRFFTGHVACDRLLDVQRAVTAMELGLPLMNTGLPDADGAAPAAEVGGRVMAVIDRGCALLNDAFVDDAGRTRLRAVWDQSGVAHAPWRRPADFGYGREIQAAEIDALRGRRAAEGEPALYRQLGLLIDDHGRLREHAHGTPVLDAAAGRAGHRLSSVKPAAPDAAASAPLIFVSTPGLAPGDTTGASPGAHLLDALHYIRCRAGVATPVTVNLSLGALAGPHDGTSLVEHALDAFLQRDGHMALIVAGGNAAQDRWHVAGAFDQQGGRATLHWQVLPDDRTDSFCEIWFGGDAVRARDTTIELRSPAGTSVVLAAGQRQAVLGQPGRPVAALIRHQHQDRLVLVALEPTAGARAAALHGTWRLTIGSPSAMRFDVWIQRDEPDVERGPSPQSRFAWVSVPHARVNGLGTLNSLATGKEVEVVGAANAEDGRPARYTSRGDGQGRDIDVLAVADESWTANGLLAAGVRSGRHVRIGGSSMASPVYARWRFNVEAAKGGQTPPKASTQRPSARQMRTAPPLYNALGPLKPRRR